MKQYWATLPPDELDNVLADKVKRYNRYLEDEGFLDIWDESLDLYYGKQVSDSTSESKKVNFVGDDGELTAFGVNRYRNNIRHVLALATSQKPSYDCKAKNTDIDSQNEARLGNVVINDYMQEKRIGRAIRGAAERGLVYNRGHVYEPWEPSSGRPHTTQVVEQQDGTQVEKVVYEGDIEAYAKSPVDVISDPDVRDDKQHKWRIVRMWENRWDLAAKHPKFSEDIINIGSRDELGVRNGEGFRDITRLEGDGESDIIAVYYFYHMRSDAIPSGRCMKFLSNGQWIFDGAMPFRNIPVRTVKPGEVFDTAEGYTEAHDLIALQMVLNTLHSSSFSNQQATAVQMLWLPDGCNVSNSQIKGLAVLKGGHPDAAPRGINLTNTPAEIFKTRDEIKNEMREILGLNSAITGDPGTAKSGIAIAKMQAMAIQYSSTLQASIAECQEDVGTDTLHLLQDFAATERVASAVGKLNRTALKSWSKDKIANLDRVTVDLGNPMSNTMTGRMEMAADLLAKGKIDAREYIQILQTGNLETAIQSEDSEKYLIQQENEDMLDGKPVKAITGDAHLLHGKEHKVLANDPEIRRLVALGDQKATQLLQNVLNHIKEHEMLWMGQNPYYGMLSGEPPPPPPPMPPPMDPNAPPPPPGAPGEAPPPPPPEALPPPPMTA